MKHKKSRLKAQAISFAAGVLLIGMLILGTQSSALAGPVFDNPDFILLFPGASQKISYDLPDGFRVDQRIFHTCYVLALPDDFADPTPLDFTITTEPSIVSGDAAVVVAGLFNTTPTYKLNYVSGGKFTAKVSSVPYGLGLFFTFATRPYNDPEFPVTVKQTFTFAPPAK
jgi:hypothetical protein